MRWRTLDGKALAALTERAPIIDDAAEERPRIFTLQEACALLPALKEHLQRLRRAHAEAERARRVLMDLERQCTRATALELARPLRQRREELGLQVDQMREVVSTILATGVEIKRLSPALLDFHCLRDDRIVYLCWQEGEETISYWHELHGGFDGRRPL